MRVVQTPGLSTKIAAGLDIAATLAVEHIGTTLKLPFYHPIILGVVGGLTFALFAWKDEITGVVFKFAEPVQNKNTYSFRKNELSRMINKISDVQLMPTKKRAKKRQEVYLLAEPSTPN